MSQAPAPDPLFVIGAHQGFHPQSHLGGERYEYSLLASLKNPGFRFAWLVPQEILASLPALPKNHEIIPLARRSGWRRIFAEARALRSLLESRPGAVVRFHSVTLGAPVALLLRLSGARNPFLFQHLHIDPPRFRYLVSLAVARLTGARFSAISEFSANELRELGIRRVVHVPTVLHSPLPAADAGAKKLYDLCFVGGLVARKRPELVLALANALAERSGRKVRVAIVGRGPLLDSLRSTRVHPLVEAVFFSNAGDDEKWDILKASKIFLFPSALEGFGYAPLEAALLGLWVVSARAGSLPEIVEDFSNGRLVGPDEFLTEASVRTVQELLETPPPAPTADQYRKWTDLDGFGRRNEELLRAVAQRRL